MDIKKSYLKKINQITKYNQGYYEKNEPLVTDYEYDELKYEILELEKKYKFLIHKNSPSKIVGFKPSSSMTNNKDLILLSDTYDTIGFHSNNANNISNLFNVIQPKINKGNFYLKPIKQINSNIKSKKETFI